MHDFSEQLSKYIPKEAAPIISQWINDSYCEFKISRSRKTKLGDYRAPYRGQPHKITVNYDLNPFSFLITTVHEFAHLKTWESYKGRVKPHGTEWKESFQVLIQSFIGLNIFPNDILSALENYIRNPAASSCTDINLFQTLKKYDKDYKESITIDSIELNGYFATKSGRIFQKLEKLRKRYKCKEISSNNIYLIHPIAEVIPIDNPPLN